jgi:hypothetical protein
MTCANGRIVRDPQVRVISRNVATRATARVGTVMADPEVRAALRMTVDANVDAALTRAGAKLDAVANQH